MGFTELRAAAQQALEALEADNSKLWPSEKRTTAITALKAALAEPVQESVKLPTTAAEAELMAKAGLMWLEQNAPDRLLKSVQEPQPLKRGTTGRCTRKVCECEKEGMGLECIYLEPVIDGYPLWSGMPKAEPCQCGDRPAAKCPGEWEPGCDLGNNPKHAKRVEMTPKELAASIKRGEKWKVAEPGSLMIAAQQFLEWNRAQSRPPVTVGFELGVFEAVKKAYPFPPQRPAETVQEPVAWVLQSELDELLTCNHMGLGADSPTIWAPYDISTPSADMGLVPLYTVPPQRKPLTEEEIREMFFAELRALPSYPSAIEELPVRLARAIERAHQITP